MTNSRYNLRPRSTRSVSDDSTRVQGNPRPAKRAKATQSTNSTNSKSHNQKVKVPREFVKVRGKFACLEGMMPSLPLDVGLFEIFVRLDPRDLLSLSRTSKRLRYLLMSRSSELIWRAARLNFEGGLPPLPPGLNEPQFAHLLFDLYCHVCNKPSHCDNVLWTLRVRCCRGCEKGFPRWTSRLHISLGPFVHFNIIPKERIIVENFERIIYDQDVAKELSAQYLALESEQDRRAWVDQKQKELQEIEQHACHCQAWHTTKLEQHARALRDIRDQRKEALLTRLEAVDLDYEARYILSGQSEFQEASALIKLCSLNQSKRLTNQGWNSIEHNLVKMLSIHKKKRLQQEHLQVCRERCDQLKQLYLDILSTRDLRDPLPGVGDILTDPVLEALVWDTAKEEELTPAFLRSRLLHELPRISSEWKSTQTERLFQILKRTRHDATHSDLHLATTIFGCTSCNSLMICRQAFYHRCCFENRAPASRSDDRMRAVNPFYDTVDWDGPWSSRSLFIHHPSAQLVERIVIGAGLNPLTATAADLTLAHPLIECTSDSADFFPGRLFVTWAAALTHNLTIEDEIFFVINRFGQESSAIRAKEPVNFFTTIHCAHCHKEISFYELSHHLLSTHDVDAVTSTSTVTDIHRYFDTHWYWSPYDNLNIVGMDFRYDP
ncbi:hypothetical protein C8R42DRAFT_724633 [Lentinula raphanica]|nr:hypothetical protein C8R42DRAFT_724633 [Lentinula raphanica]